MATAFNGSFLMRYVAAVLAIAWVLPASASPMTCEAVKAQLSRQFESDDAISSKPSFSDPHGGLPSVMQVDIKLEPLSAAYFWCARDTRALRDISLTFPRLDMALPSKASKAEAIAADVACTVVDAEMSDCDALVKQSWQSAEKLGGLKIGITDDGWSLWVLVNERTLTFDFMRPTDAEDPPRPLHLSRE